jgi:hypothetical protein
MSDKCGVCNLPVNSSRSHNKVQCTSCKTAFHGNKCLQLAVEYADSEDINKWLCETCEEKTNQTPQKATLQDVWNEIKLMRSEQKTMQSSLNGYYDLLEEITKRVQTQDNKITECEQKIECLQSENAVLRDKNTNMFEKVCDLEQYSRRNCVEVHGIPEIPGEDVITTVQRVGEALNFQIQVNMIDACHRLGPKNNNVSTRGIVIKFVRRLDKEGLLKAKKVKRNLATSHLDPSISKFAKLETPIYINEMLSPHNRQLFNKARHFKQEHGIKFLWISNGNILMRKSDNSAVFKINSIDDFKDVH